MASDPIQQSQNAKKLDLSKTNKDMVVELLHDKAHLDDLLLLVNDEKMLITEAELEKLLHLKHAKDLQKNTKLDPSHDSAKDFISFLKSPMGEKAKQLALDLLVLIVVLKKWQGQEAQRSQLLRLLILGMLRLTKLLERKEAVKELNAAYLQQINKSLAYARAAANQSTVEDSVGYDDILMKQILDAYALAPQLLEQELAQKLIEAQLLEQEIVAHSEEFTAITERYNILHTHLGVLDDHSDALETMQNPAQKIEATEAILKIVKEGMQKVTANIQQHLINGEDTQANLLMNHLDGLNVQREGMKTMLSVINSEKSYYNAEGQTISSYKDAAYAVSNENQLYKDKESGKFYLLKPGQDIASMSTEEKSEAQAKFEDSKPEIRMVKDSVKLYQNSELNAFETKKNELILRSEAMQKDILDLSNKFNEAKAAEANALALINDVKTDLTKIPVPKPAPTSTNVSGKPQMSITQTYRQVLNLMRFNPTEEAISRLRSSLVLPNGKPNKAAQDAVTNTIKPGELILPTKMNSLLAKLAILGVNPNKANVTSIPDKHPNAVEEKQNSYTSPTPLKTTPSPFKF